MAEAKERTGTGKKRVMVAIEEHECSHYALEWTLLNLKPTISSPLLLITVQPFSPFTYVAAASYSSPPQELIQSMQEHQKQAALALLERAKEICAKHGVDVETITEMGEPKEVICQVAEQQNIELLVMGSHARGAVERFFLGSVSNYCVHHAKCPVLVVKQDSGKKN
ncbi:Adenine nucleotide alpha hydrolases-like superfamily protein [Rhynchospora pubera]|uniref:Adenine nucleotide alpha hydrolases-like superfamily protein n=1 Tax=Rhynchospora pubera TaxID=906938 RepID=A0AAV8EI79_9POAL|nr:Adenine nucleotide alpha hydrolases-like superfamily protein [Rhynchospora pubera]